MENPEPFDITALVTDVLEKLNVPYVVGGSMASIIHGMIRTTMDADIVAALKFDQAAHFVQALQEQFYVDETAVHQAIQRRSSFNLIHFDSMFKVDIFIPKDRAFDRQQLTRRLKENLPGSAKSVWVLSAEDIILAKLDWFCLGGEVSERQWRDILGIIRTQQDKLDIAYLNKWGESLNVSDLLDRAITEGMQHG